MSDFNIFGSICGDRPIESLGTTIEAPYKEDVVPNNEQFSVESFSNNALQDRDDIKKTALEGKYYRYFDCDEVMACGGPRKRPLIFTKSVCNETKTIWWEFYLIDPNFTQLNDFVVKLESVKENDCILIHGPANCYCDDAEVICSAIKRCKAKEKVISAPYILDMHAASILLSGTKILGSICNIMRIEAPRVGGGTGAMQDARTAFESSFFQRDLVLKTLINEGFITTEECTHLKEEQGGVCLHGKRLAEAIGAFNQKHT